MKEKQAKGRTDASLKESRSERQELLQRFENTIIESIMVHNRSDRAIDLTVDRRYDEVKRKREEFLDDYISKSEDAGKIADMEQFKDQFRSGFEGSRGAGKTLSRFSQNICRNTIKFYTEKGDIVVDPFAGHNSRMEGAWRTGRHYYGQDLCAEFMEDNRKIRDMLLKESEGKIFMKKQDTIIDLTEGDSRVLPWEDNFGDFTITSPPYWYLEDYGPEEAQLGYGQDQTYPEFLHDLGLVAKENFRVLKPGAYCVWFINDFRINGEFFDFHGDTKNLLVEAGFRYHDIIIADLGPSLRSVFLASAFKSKILPKRHEYGIVVQKPLK
jgi:DNA modification methylase